jgi:dUTP pyrophosphatase
VGIILINLNGMPVVVDTDKPIAQLIIEPYLTVAWEKAESLSDTKRGLGGFGSSDVKVSPIALNESTPQMAEAYREANYIR